MEKDEKNELTGYLRAEKHMMMHRRNWLRHNAMVPKGFLRYHVLQALSEKPMSGSELMDQIEKHTGGNWKPSPGSIYPLLSWLQDNACIKELPTENGMKRYELTQSGKGLLEEQAKIREKISQNACLWTNPFFDRFLGNLPPKKTEEIRASVKQLFLTSMKTLEALRENYSEKDLDEVLAVLKEVSEKLEKITRNLKGEKV